MTEERDSRGSSGASGGKPAGDDVVVLGAQLPDGKGVGVVRLREGQVEVGRVQPMEEGKPILGEVVKLKPRPDSPRVCDVEVQYTPSRASDPTAASAPAERARVSSGPPQVASDEYRNGWDVIWAHKKKPSAPS